MRSPKGFGETYTERPGDSLCRRLLRRAARAVSTCPGLDQVNEVMEGALGGPGGLDG